MKTNSSLALPQSLKGRSWHQASLEMGRIKPLFYLHEVYLFEKNLINGWILRLCLFLEKYFSGNYFLNFSVFICHQESWSTKNTFQSTENTFRSTKNTFQSISVKEKFNLVFRKVFSLWLCLFSGKCLFASRKVGQ